MDADAKYLLQCTSPSCQKPLPYKWGIAQGFRAYTGEWYCDEFCHDMDDQRRWRFRYAKGAE
jgi:hypothetical protein